LIQRFGAFLFVEVAQLETTRQGLEPIETGDGIGA
jgi:hypothetical protein